MVSGTSLGRAYSPYATFEELGSGMGIVPFVPFLGDAAVDELLRLQKKQMWLNVFSTAVMAVIAGATLYKLVKGKR